MFNKYIKSIQRAFVAFSILMLIGFIVPISKDIGMSSSLMSSHAMDAYDLHLIVNSWISWQKNHPMGMPANARADIYSFVARLICDGAIKNPSCWFSKLDSYAPGNESILLNTTSNIPGNDLETIRSLFQNEPVAWAVALIPDISKLPGNTPVMWMRGLQPDGKWQQNNGSNHWGGHIAFADGTTKFYINGTIMLAETPLRKWGTDTPTINIVEALPPSTHWSEFQPQSIDPSTLHLFSENSRHYYILSQLLRLLMVLVPLSGVVVCSIVVATRSNLNLSYGMMIAFFRIVCGIAGIICSWWFFEKLLIS